MLGTGLGHYLPLAAYCLFWVMTLASLLGKPLHGLYFAMPFIPYRTMRDKLLDFPLGANMLTILLLAIILGALLHGKRPPKSKLYMLWLLFAVYLYISMWFGSLSGNAPAPLWLSEPNFVTWKDYIVLPLVFLAAGMVVEDRKAIRWIVIITGASLFLVDRSALLESLSHSWASFDENKRTTGPLAYGSNQLAAFLAQFGMFFWGFARVIPRKKVKLVCYGLTALTVLTTMYCFSRGAYLALLVSVAVLAFLEDRKLLLALPMFLLTWTAIVPTAVTQRVQMTQTADGKLETSAEERVRLWENAKTSFLHDPLLGNGFATFQFSENVDGLKDTHNWYVKVLVETGLVGGIFAVAIVIQLLRVTYRLFKETQDPMYKAIGLGSLLAVVSCLVANCFGDRWTYLEINGLLWILVAANLRAIELTREGTGNKLEELGTTSNAFPWTYDISNV